MKSSNIFLTTVLTFFFFYGFRLSSFGEDAPSSSPPTETSTSPSSDTETLPSPPPPPVIDPTVLKTKAEEGDAESQFTLAAMYYKGEGLPQNYKEAAYWYRRAAQQGHLLAQKSLGEMLADGKGIDKNIPQGYKWLSIAAAQGNKEAADRRDKLAVRLTPKELSQAQDSAVNFTPYKELAPEKKN